MPTFTVRNRAAATGLGVVALGLGAALLMVGFALLATLAVAGGVLGVGVAASRWLRGGGRSLPRGESLDRAGAELDPSLDPSLEVRSAVPPVIRRRSETDVP